MGFDLSGLNNIPTWLWAIIIGVGVFLYIRSQRNKKK